MEDSHRFNTRPQVHTTFDPDTGYITIVSTYAVAPEPFKALLDLLARGTAENPGTCRVVSAISGAAVWF
jgi:hypothetical protein